MDPKAIVKEPLTHFFLLGAVLFVIYGVLNQGSVSAPDEIVVDNARISALTTQFQRVWQRKPTAGELDSLIENWVREEVLYREGLAMNFERDDPVIRRRIAQKVAFMSDAIVDDNPDDVVLDTWLQENPDRYRLEPVLTVQQVYIDPGRHAEDLDGYIESLHGKLLDNDTAAIGDATLLPRAMAEVSLSELERRFGRKFAESVNEIPVGEWSGPVQSGFGLHFVYVSSRIPGREATLEEVRGAVERDVVAARREDAEEAIYQSMRERYRIVIPDDATTLASGAQ
jgi:hypothetical protein